MALFSRIKTWVSNEVLTAADLNAEFNNLLNNTKPESIEDYSVDTSAMQSTTDPGGVGTESLATSLSGEITRLRYAIKRIAGGAQWYVNPGRSLASGSLSVQTGDVAANAITRAKLESLGQQTSSSSGTFSTTSTSLTDITNLSISITTTGRPVFLMLQPDGTGSSTGALCASDFVIALLRDGSEIARFNQTGVAALRPIPSCYIDAPAAATYTYKFQGLTGNGANALQVLRLKLIAYEL